MADLNKETSEIAKEKRKQRAKERLNSLNSGDITRGLNSGIKDRSLVSDTYSTQQAKEKVTAKAKAKSEKAGTASKTSISTIAKKTTRSTTSKTTASKAKETQAKKTKATAVNPEVFEDDILLDENTGKKKSKKQIGNIVVDENALENISTATTDKRSRRNKVIISVLIVSILLIWGAVLVMLLVKPKTEKHNCYLYLGGDSSSKCELLMNNQKASSWLMPEGLEQGTIYTVDIDLKVKESGSYFVKFMVEVKNDDTAIQSAVEVAPGTKQTVDQDGNTWYYYSEVAGNSTLELINKITFLVDWTNEPLATLNDSNVELNIYVEVYEN